MTPHPLFSNVNLHFSALSEKNDRDANEDSYCADRIGDYYVFAVADGLGGHAAGEVASGIAIECLKNAMKFCDGNLKKTLREAMYNADEQILAHGEKFPEKRGMGTTLIAAVVDDSLNCTIVNVGDSRAHIITTNDVKTTKDHSYVNQLAERGEVKPEDIWQHPLSMVLTQALGDPDNEVAPDFYEFDLHDTLLLLSSDGLHDFVRRERIQEMVLEQGKDPKKTCAALIREALEDSSDDNITVLLVHEGP
jgi:serine/threonine protein phosphatase PrpC